MRGYDGLVYRFLCCAEFFRILPWSGSEKKLQKFLLKSLEVMKKSLPLQPLSATAVLKKSLKKSAERFGGNM